MSDEGEETEVQVMGFQFKGVVTVGRKNNGWATKKAVDSKYGPNDEASDAKTGEAKTFIVFGFNMDSDAKAIGKKIKEMAKVMKESGETLVEVTEGFVAKMGVDFKPDLEALREALKPPAQAPEPEKAENTSKTPPVSAPVETSSQAPAQAQEITIGCWQCNKPAEPGNEPLCSDCKKEPYCKSCFQRTDGGYKHCAQCNARINSRKKNKGMEYPEAVDDLKLEIAKEKAEEYLKQSKL